MEQSLSFTPVLKAFPKKKPELSESHHELCIADESALPKLKKDSSIPKKMWEGFELTVREPYKAIQIPRGVDQPIL